MIGHYQNQSVLKKIDYSRDILLANRITSTRSDKITWSCSKAMINPNDRHSHISFYTDERELKLIGFCFTS
jgi:hypothetical protein